MNDRTANATMIAPANIMPVIVVVIPKNKLIRTKQDTTLKHIILANFKAKLYFNFVITTSCSASSLLNFFSIFFSKILKHFDGFEPSRKHVVYFNHM